MSPVRSPVTDQSNRKERSRAGMGDPVRAPMIPPGPRSPRPKRNHQTKRQIRRFYLSINQCAYATPIEGPLHAITSVRQLLGHSMISQLVRKSVAPCCGQPIKTVSIVPPLLITNYLSVLRPLNHLKSSMHYRSTHTLRFLLALSNRSFELM